MLFHPWFMGMLILVLAHQIIQKILDINVSMLDSYLDPLMFMPILLHLILWEQRFLLRKGLLYVLPWKQIIAFLIIVSIFCEYFFPRWSNGFTRDYWDILCYTLGAVFFGLFLNRPLKNGRTWKVCERSDGRFLG